jgi:hypothetical protein
MTAAIASGREAIHSLYALRSERRCSTTVIKGLCEAISCASASARSNGGHRSNPAKTSWTCADTAVAGGSETGCAVAMVDDDDNDCGCESCDSPVGCVGSCASRPSAAGTASARVARWGA